VSAARGEQAVLRVTVGPSTLRLGGNEVPASEGQLETAAGQVADELETRERFAG
jgi:hypothetical protein